MTELCPPILFSEAITWLRTMWYPPVYIVTATLVLIVLMVIMRYLAPKVYALTVTTAKEGTNQPLFYVLLVGGLALIFVLSYLPFNTLGEDVKMHLSVGLTLIKIPAIFLALWLSGISIAEEIEGKTALMLLSKPISRVQLVLGKFFGVLMPVIVLFIVLGGFFLATCSFKVVHDARETCETEPESQKCLDTMVRITPGIGMTFLETATMTAVAVALSTRLPMLANFTVCICIYLLGHLVQYLSQFVQQFTQGQYAIVDFISNALAAVLPVLGHFSIETPIGANQSVPLDYLAWSGLYCLLYCTVAMFVAMLLFEDRDLA